MIDLVEMKLLTFAVDKDERELRGRTDSRPTWRTTHDAWREQLLEKLYNFSNELMELALSEQPIPPALIRKALREATVHMQVQPVLCGSALHGMGVQPVLDAVEYYLPSPLDVPPVEGESIGDKKKAPTKLRRGPSRSEPFCGLVFKVLPAKTGDMHWVRVYSGMLKSNSRVLNPGKDVKENVAQLWHIHATKKEEQVDSVQARRHRGHHRPADVDHRRHDLRHARADPAGVDQVSRRRSSRWPSSRRTRPSGRSCRTRWRCSSGRTRRCSVQSSETGQTLISGMGELHLEIIKNRLLRDFNLNVKFHKPQVSYRESIDHAVEVVGECHRMLAGQQLFAKPQDSHGAGAARRRFPVMLLDRRAAGWLAAGPPDGCPGRAEGPAAKAAAGSPAIR